MSKKTATNNIVFLSTFPPRECGIATFTQDLARSLATRFRPAVKPQVIAINNESTDMYRYGKNVAHQITATDIEDYVAIAQKINRNDAIKLVHVQHEFGIFGGEHGNHLIPFFQVIEKPVIVTFHTIIPNPKRDLKNLVQVILKYAKAVIVMNELSKKMLQDHYGAHASKVQVIPHGVPQVPFGNGKKEKDELGLLGKRVLSTFGLLNKGKGIEYALRALPAIIERFPDTLYLIIGATHPVVRKYDGEKYRTFLEREAEQLGIARHVKFYNKYLSLEELLSYLKATDIYLSPTLDAHQSVSGTLSYALGCGRPVISSVSIYAQSVVTPGKGILVPQRNSEAIAQAVIKLLQGPKLLNKLAHAAYAETRHMTWPNVALAHVDLYRKHITLGRKEKMPLLILKHLKTLTDDFGVIQFAKHAKPDLRYGYCTDDNARALIVAATAARQQKHHEMCDGILERCFAFIERAQQRNGAVTNLFTAERATAEQKFSEDTQGRVVWALGFLIAENSLTRVLAHRAKTMFRKITPRIIRLKSPRAIAFAMLGLCFYTKAYPRSHERHTLEHLAGIQLKRFRDTASHDWMWFENHLTYSNSKLPESLFYAYLATAKKEYLDVAEKSLRFLMRITFGNEYFSPIGQNGWYFRSGNRAYFDQQPEDASSMVQTLVTAYRATRNELYRTRAMQAFQWFLGKNHLHQLVYDATTGGCHDGVGKNTLNLNQGAESTLSYLLARLAMEELATMRTEK